MLRLASCGNDCNLCPRYIATRAGDVERLREVAELWFRLGLRDTLPSADEMACHGCSSTTWCRHGIRECTHEKGVDNCGQCQEYPCQTVQITFRETARCARDARQRCSNEEYAVLERAFFLKRQKLEGAREEWRSRTGGKPSGT